MSCGPDPYARSPALGGELSLHELLWLSRCCWWGSRTRVPGGGTHLPFCSASIAISSPSGPPAPR